MKRKVVVVSLFSGMDIFLLGCMMSGVIPGFANEKNFWAAYMHSINFKHPDGSSIMEFISISEEERDILWNSKNHKGEYHRREDLGVIDGKQVRTRLVQEMNGFDIRRDIVARYGSDVIIILIGGPPCTDFTTLNQKRDFSENSRNNLVFEYVRILKELEPDVAIMEEVPDFESPIFKPIFAEFLQEASKLPYNFAHQEMCSTHYGSNQKRTRVIFEFVHEKWNSPPVFPQPDLVNVKRVKDFLDIDYFLSGHFSDPIKTKNHFMCTVTSGNPQWFFKEGRKYAPTTQQRLLCQDVEEGDYIIPEDVPITEVKKATGNAVPAKLAKAIMETVIKDVLKLKRDGDFWIPIDNS